MEPRASVTPKTRPLARRSEWSLMLYQAEQQLNHSTEASEPMSGKRD